MPFQKARAVTLFAASGASLPAARFVVMGGSGVTSPAVDSDADGVLLEPYDDTAFAAGTGSNAVPVAIEGIVEVEASAAITLGSEVAVEADGRAKTASTGNVVVGKCVRAAGASGEFADVLLLKRGGVAA